jgi:hypothetical protein
VNSVLAAAGGVGWFPQEYAQAFNVAKGLTGLLAVVLLVAHMDRVWSTEALTLGRRLRYLALLAFVVVVAGGSVEQINQATVVSYRNLGGMVATLTAVAAAVVSIWESRQASRAEE